MKKAVSLVLSIVLFCSLFEITGFEVTASSWSNNWEYWSQGASDDSDMRLYGCWVVAQAKLIKMLGINNSSTFNPDVYLAWERTSGHINSGFYQLNGDMAPVDYASAMGEDLSYRGIRYSTSDVWDCINNGYYGIICVRTSSSPTGNHWILLDNNRSKSTGIIYCYDSWSGYSESGIKSLSEMSYTFDKIYIYEYKKNTVPIKLTLDPNGGSGGTRVVYFKKGVNRFYTDAACTNEITKINPPTRDGYTFDQYYGDGSSGGENGERYIYSDGSFASDLCTDITKDATFYAKWTQKTYYLDVNLLVDGEEVVGNAGEYCTFDVYINGALVEDDAVDYYQKHPAGTTYEIRDIKAAGCNTYVGVHNGSLSGTIGNGDVDVYLSFVTSHNWGNWTNLSETQHQRVCANDPSHVDVSDHNWVMIVDEPTCISPAVRKFVCGECGAVYTVTDGEWSDWREGEGFGFDGAEVETKTQYRYSDRTTVSSEWKQSGTGTIDYVVSWPSGFDTSSSIYSKYNKSASGYENGTQKRVINSNSKIGYIYWHWCRNQTQSGGPKNRIVYPYKTGSYSTFHAFYSAEDYEYRTFSNDDPAYVSSQSSVCGDSFYWVDTRVTINRAAYTDYVKENEYSWSDFSEWQDTPVVGSDARVVETRKVFRFKYPAEYGDHKWDSGTITVAPTTTTPGIITYTCTLCGETRMEIVSALKSEGVCGDNVIWRVDGDTLIISGYGPMYDYSRSGDGVGSGSPWKGYSFEKVVFEEGVTSVGAYAFDGCSWIKSVDFADSVVDIGYWSFYCCYQLNANKLPDNLKRIGNAAFRGCETLNISYIPGSCETIGASAFEYCYGLEELVMGNGVKAIGACAFSCCKNLETISIPDSVTEIGTYAFMDCFKLKKATIMGMTVNIGNWAFSGPDSVILYIHRGSDVRSYAEEDNIDYCFIEDVAIDNGDFDGDGQITVADALSALRIAAKLAEETPQSIEIGDIDGDGHVTVSDALSILRVAAKLADASSLV